MIVTIPPHFWLDERTNEIKRIDKPVILDLRHSLLSIHKWEQKWHVPFLDQNTKFTGAMLLDYIRCMNINRADTIAYTRLTDEQIKNIWAYTKDPMTATVVPESNEKNEPEILTAEVIYYYMFAYGIPKECERWHLNTLLTLLRLSSHKQKEAEDKASKKVNKGNKPSKKDYIDPVKFAAINDARLKKMRTHG